MLWSGVKAFNSCIYHTEYCEKYYRNEFIFFSIKTSDIYNKHL